VSEISAQVSLYPLRQPDLGPVIREAWRIFDRYGLHSKHGEMSTLIWGGAEAVFAALQEAFAQAAAQGDAVMVVTFSNACPQPSSEKPPS